MNDTTPSTYYRRLAVTLGIIAAFTLLILFVMGTARVIFIYIVAMLIGIGFANAGRFTEKHTPLGHKTSVIIAGVAVAAAIIGLGWLITPRLWEQAQILTDSLDGMLDNLAAVLQGSQWGERLLMRIDPGNSASTFSLDMIPFDSLSNVASSVGTAIATIVLVYLVGLMFALTPKVYQNLVVGALPDAAAPKAREIFDRTGHALSWWLVARFTSMLVIGVLTYIGLLLLGVPAALTLAVVAALLSFIPNIGPLLSVVPAILVGLTQSINMALYIIALYLVLQTIESYFITPYIERRTVSLPPALTIFVQLVLTLLVGVVGALVAAPLIVVGMVLVKTLYYPYVLNKSEDELNLHIGPGDVPGS